MRQTLKLRIGILGLLVTAVVPHAGAGSTEEATDLHPHTRASCTLCHVGRAAAEEAEEVDVCATCHEQVSPRESSLGDWGPDGWSEDQAPPADDHGSSCTRCHSFHAPTGIAFQARRTDIGDEKVATHCRSCHSHTDEATLSRLTEGHLRAGALYHWLGSDLASYTPSEVCLLCHDRTKQPPTRLPIALPATPRFGSHASHPYGIQMSGGGNFFKRVVDPRIPLFDGRIECLTCHDLSAQTEDLVIAFETKYEMCRGCHTQGLPQAQGSESFVQR